MQTVTDALVLRERKLDEQDRLLTLLKTKIRQARRELEDRLGVRIEPEPPLAN